MSSRPPQSRRGSLAEALANIAAGYLLAIVTQRIAYPMFGIQTTLAADGAIAAIFTLVSLGRSYALRRIFERCSAAR